MKSAVTDEDLLARQAALQDRAREVLAALDLGALTADAGPLLVTGSFVSGLMCWPEVDVMVLVGPDFPPYPHGAGGLDIYTAVIDDGVRTLDGFSAWLAARGPGGAG